MSTRSIPLFALLLSACNAGVVAQSIPSDTATRWVGQRIIMLRGMGAVHITDTSQAHRTVVGINLVMPVSRVDGRKVWIVSTSGDDSGWVDIGSIRSLNRAIPYLDSLVASDPHNWDAYLRRAEAEHALNLRDVSTSDYSRAIALHPDEAFLYLRRGRHYGTLKECAKEIADFDRAIEIAPTSARQDYNLVAELHSLKSGVYFACPDTTLRDYRRGLSLARQAVDEDPSRPTLLTILAEAYAQAGDFGKAVMTQRQALARPDFPPGYRAQAERALARYVSDVAKRELTTFVFSAECYSLAYSDPVKNVSSSLFPMWIELFPGTDSGSVAGRPHPTYAYGWPAMTKYSWWKRIPGDSIEVNFSGNYEALHIHVQRVGSRLVGRATYLSDVITGGPDPSMHAEATREACPTPQP